MNNQKQTFQEALYYVDEAYKHASFVDCEEESSQYTKVAYSKVDYLGYKYLFKRVWLGKTKVQHIFFRVPTHLQSDQSWIEC